MEQAARKAATMQDTPASPREGHFKMKWGPASSPAAFPAKSHEITSMHAAVAVARELLSNR